MQLPSSKELKSLDSTHSKQMANTPGHFYIQKVLGVICRKVIQIIASFDWAHYVAHTVQASRSNRQKKKEGWGKGIERGEVACSHPKGACNPLLGMPSEH